MNFELTVHVALWIAGAGLIGCWFTSMACMAVMGIATKGLKVMLPWEAHLGVEVYRRQFPTSLIYRIFYLSAIGTAVFAGLFLLVVLWTEFGLK